MKKRKTSIIALAAILIMVISAIPANVANADMTFSPWSTKNVYRLWLPANGDHMYTMSTTERDWLVRESGWVDEGVSWAAPTDYNSYSPVFRVYNEYNGDHVYTTNETERNYILANRNGTNLWVDEGIAWYSADSLSGDESSLIPVYRMFNPMQPDYWPGSHHYTTDFNEVWTLANGGVWQYEGIAWYGSPDQRAKTIEELKNRGTLTMEDDTAYAQVEAVVKLNDTGASGSSAKVVMGCGGKVASFGLGNQSNLREQFPWYTSNTEFVLENIYDPSQAAQAGMGGKNYLRFELDDQGNDATLNKEYKIRLTWNKYDKRLRAYVNDKELTVGYEQWTQIDFPPPFTIAIEGGVKHGGDRIDADFSNVKFKVGDGTETYPVYKGMENGWNDVDLDFFGLNATVLDPGTQGPDARYTIWDWNKDPVGGYNASMKITGTADAAALQGHDWDTCFQVVEPRTGQTGKPLSAQVNISQWQSSKNDNVPNPQ